MGARGTIRSEAMPQVGPIVILARIPGLPAHSVTGRIVKALSIPCSAMDLCEASLVPHRSHTLVMRKPLHVSSLAKIVEAAPLALVGMEGAPPVAQVLQKEAAALREASLPGAKPGVLLIGPEGDFTPEEVEQLIAAGAKPVGLGPNRLRVETAALALLAATTLCTPSVSSDA